MEIASHGFSRADRESRPSSLRLHRLTAENERENLSSKYTQNCQNLAGTRHGALPWELSGSCSP